MDEAELALEVEEVLEVVVGNVGIEVVVVGPEVVFV